MGAFEGFKQGWARILKLPTEPPTVPADHHQQVETFRASPRFLSYRMLLATFPTVMVAGPALVGLLVAVAALAPSDLWLAVALGVLAGGLIALGIALVYVTVRLEYELRYYLVTDRSLRIREGAFGLREITLTFANVQNVTVEQGPLERLFGIANVVVDTAGGGRPGGDGAQQGTSGHRGVLAGIENAAQVRDRIRGFLSALPERAGLGDPEEDHTGLGHDELQRLAEVREAARSLREALEAARVRAGQTSER